MSTGNAIGHVYTLLVAANLEVMLSHRSREKDNGRILIVFQV